MRQHSMFSFKYCRRLGDSFFDVVEGGTEAPPLLLVFDDCDGFGFSCVPVAEFAGGALYSTATFFGRWA